MTQIIETKTNIFYLNVDILLCPVNCKGVMGKGLAKQFKEKYPECEKPYKDFCKDGIIDFNSGLWGLSYLNRKEKPRGIIFFPTKNHWKNKSNMNNILKGILSLCTDIKITEEWTDEPTYDGIAIPKLGCGLGGLNWNELKPQMIEIIKSFNLLTTFYITEY